MIEYKAFNKEQAFKISNNYMPTKLNFRGGWFIVNGIEFKYWNDAFRKAMHKERMWTKLAND